MNTEHAERVFLKTEAELRGYGDQQTIGEWVALLFTMRVLCDHTHLYPEVFPSSEGFFDEERSTMWFPKWDDFKRSYRDAFTSALSSQSAARPLRLLAPILESLLAAKTPDAILTRVVYEFDNLASRYEDLDTLSDACGPLIDQLVLRKTYGDSQQFYTSSAVAQLAARLVYSNSATTIHDPTCGFGVALTAYRKLARQGQQRYSGQDTNVRAVAIATMRLLMHGIANFKLRVGDTLADPYLEDQNQSLPTFDVILSDPPLGTKIGNYGALERDPHNRFRYGQPSRRSVEWSFIQHVLASLNPDGIATVLTSAGVLFRGGEEARTRENVIAADLLEAVIALPSGVFPSTNILGYLMVFNKAKPAERIVLFADVSGFSLKPTVTPAPFGEPVLPEFVVKALLAYSGELHEQGLMRFVARAEVSENEADLSPKRYLMTNLVSAPLELSDIQNLENQRDDAWSAIFDEQQRAREWWGHFFPLQDKKIEESELPF